MKTPSRPSKATGAKNGAAKTTAPKAADTKTTAAKTTLKPAASKTGNRGVVTAKRSAAEGLRELFVDSLKDIYWAEKALTKALPKMSKNATTEALVQAIKEHTAVTEQQVQRLERVFELIGEKAVAKKCEAMDGLIKEAQDIMESTQEGPVRDAGIIAASQKVEHYEIATYGTLVAFAKTLGEDEVAGILAETLAEEKEADVTLTEAAYNTINFDAAGEEVEGEEGSERPDTE
ncbi:ferritin-like domain-containing protein [Flavobacterium zepuense]|uniref:Ferritin-like domain-containing protein n=1 Tax=Flavobacterium zepuense TaxID=2593302 RepID=A0A552V9P4_9FLAO|nr:ferritin-like domain-containing protein [Flavobacterium zepuense]TRW27185.1 ferritin-like domain-containing protein [Flavobacterium zepuense]